MAVSVFCRQAWPYVMFVLKGSVSIDSFGIEVEEGGQAAPSFEPPSCLAPLLRSPHPRPSFRPSFQYTRAHLCLVQVCMCACLAAQVGGVELFGESMLASSLVRGTQRYTRDL